MTRRHSSNGDIYTNRFPEHWTPYEEFNVELNSWALTKLTTSNWNIRIFVISLSWLGTATILESNILSKVYQISFLINGYDIQGLKRFSLFLSPHMSHHSLYIYYMTMKKLNNGINGSKKRISSLVWNIKVKDNK